MHKYFKEIDESENISALCSLTYKDVKELENYKLKYYNSVEISEKEYDRLRKLK